MASNFQKKIIKEYESKGYSVLKHIRLNKSGYPDLQCIKKDTTDIWIECKEGSDTLKPLQQKRIDELIELGKIAYCIHETKGIIYPSTSNTTS